MEIYILDVLLWTKEDTSFLAIFVQRYIHYIVHCICGIRMCVEMCLDGSHGYRLPQRTLVMATYQHQLKPGHDWES